MIAKAQQPKRARLKTLADQYNNEHDRCLAKAKQTLVSAMKCGELLLEAKKQLKHGEWLPWVDRLHGTRRTASKYMDLAKNRKAIERQMATSSYLEGSINSATAIVRAIRKKGREENRNSLIKFKVTVGEPAQYSGVVQSIVAPMVTSAPSDGERADVSHAPAFASMNGSASGKLPDLRKVRLQAALQQLTDEFNRVGRYDNAAEAISKLRRIIEKL